MGFFANRKEKKRQKLIQKGICPNCSGKGFHSMGFESTYIHDCGYCKGTGKP